MLSSWQMSAASGQVLLLRASLGVNAINDGNKGCQDGEADRQRYSDVLPDVDTFLRVYAYTEHARRVKNGAIISLPVTSPNDLIFVVISLVDSAELTMGQWVMGRGSIGS